MSYTYKRINNMLITAEPVSLHEVALRCAEVIHNDFTVEHTRQHIVKQSYKWLIKNDFLQSDHMPTEIGQRLEFQYINNRLLLGPQAQRLIRDFIEHIMRER